MQSNRVRIAATGAALALILGACAGDGATDDTAAPTEPPSTETTMTPTTMAAESPTTTEAMDDTEEMDEGEDMEEMDDMDDMSDASSPFAALQVAAEHVGNNGGAATLAGGIVQATGMEGSIESPAAQTYATLATLLQEHVYLAGIAVNTGLGAGLDSPEFAAAAETLDGNSVELADVIGSVAPDKRDAFLDLWREHIGFFVDYAAARATGDDAAAEQALADLGGYANTAGAFFEELTGGELPAAAVEESLLGHIDTLSAAIDAAAAGDASVFAQLREAAHHVGPQGSARAIATAVVAATGMEGSVDDPASQAYTTLSALLEEHVYLAGIAVNTAYSAGLDSEAFEAAAGVLDENSQDLAALIGSIDPEQEEAFLNLWREHIGFFVDYAVGAVSDDDAAVEEAKANLGGYASTAGAFFEGLSGGALPADAVEESLLGHIDTLGAAIESLAATVTG